MPKVSSEIKWGEDNSIENAPVLSDEDKDKLEKSKAALDKLLETQGLAKYKIELFFSYRRSIHKAFPGALSLWESGSKLHGGGDEKVYECPATKLKMGTCSGIIGGSSQGYGHLVCPDCKRVWKGDQVHGEVLAVLTMQGWAQLLVKYFARLKNSADIYVKQPRKDLRVAATLKQQRQLGGEQLAKVRTKRDLIIYPLRNIIKDTANGADLEKRFYSLLTA